MEALYDTPCSQLGHSAARRGARQPAHASPERHKYIIEALRTAFDCRRWKQSKAWASLRGAEPVAEGPGYSFQTWCPGLLRRAQPQKPGVLSREGGLMAITEPPSGEGWHHSAWHGIVCRTAFQRQVGGTGIARLACPK